VRRFQHDVAREVDWVLDVMDTGHGAGGLGAAVHDGGVELADAIGVEHGALAGVEERGVLHDVDGGRDGLQRRTATLEHRVAGVECLREAGAILGLALGSHGAAGDDAGSAVNDQAVGPGGVLGVDGQSGEEQQD
jgi:hypothetical protein